MTETDSLKESTLRKLIAKLINGTQAAEILQLSTRQVRRMKHRFIKKGIQGILHQSRGKVGNQAVPQAVKKEIIKLITANYRDFGPTFASEKLSELHNIHFSNETIRHIMISGNLWKVKVQSSEQFPHVWRARKDSFGHMQQYDGSYHNWFEGRATNHLGEAVTMNCLLCSIDDATGRITYAKFDDNEGVLPTMAFWQEYITIQGKPVSMYLDRFSTYKNNQKKTTSTTLELTQFQRAARQVGIEVINAKSPQAKGRVERLFQTLQDRLVKELRLKNISTIAEANIFLTKTFIPWFNNKFAVVPKNSTDIHTKLSAKELLQLSSTFSIHDQRTIMNDYTVMHGGKLYQVDPTQSTLVRIGDKVTVQTRTNRRQVCIVKENTQLKFTEILERAQKVKTPKLEDRRHVGHKPKANHPWQFNQQKKLSLNPVLA